MTDLLGRFKEAWEAAAIRVDTGLPSLLDLAAQDAPLDDGGFIVFARTPRSSRSIGRPLFTIVLAGVDFIHSQGKPFAGLTIDEMLDPAQAASITALYDTILANGKPHTWTTLSISYNTPPRRYTRTLVPIAAPHDLPERASCIGRPSSQRPSMVDLAPFSDATGWLAGLWVWHADSDRPDDQTDNSEVSSMALDTSDMRAAE